MESLLYLSAFLLVILVFKMAPCILLKCYLVFYMQDGWDVPAEESMLHKLCSGMGYSAIGCGFNFN